MYHGTMPVLHDSAPARPNSRSPGFGILPMWYFAYGSNLNARAVAEWCRHHGHRPLALQGGKPAVLDNYRLGFPVFSEYWGGGIADIVYDPGKYVMGVLFELQEVDLAVFVREGVRCKDA